MEHHGNDGKDEEKMDQGANGIDPHESNNP
jgi:hypothetical protein